MTDANVRSAARPATDGAPSPGSSQGGLVRGLGLWDATMIVMGSMIGSGIFLTSAETSRLTGAPGLLLLAWALAGVLTLTGALCCGELSAMMPHAGGQYVFLRESFGRLTGFLFGWSLFLVIQTGTIAAVAVAFAKFAGVLVLAISSENLLIPPLRIGSYALMLSTQQLVAIAVIAFLTVSNSFGLRTGRLVQNVFTSTKTLALALVIGVGCLLGWSADSAFFSASFWNPFANAWTPEGAQSGMGAVPVALALVALLGKGMVGPLFSQSAWNNVTFTAGEVRDPHVQLPRALLIGCGSVVALYLLANVAYLATLPFESIQHAPQDRVGVAVLERVFGPTGGVLMAVAILISTFGCNNGLILAGARVTYAMAKDGLFFGAAARVNRAAVPAVALAAQGIWAALLTLPVTVTDDAATGQVRYGNLYGQLLEFVIPADLTFSLLMVASVVVLRHRAPLAERPYRTLGYPVTPFVFMALAAFLIIDLVIMSPLTSGIGFLIVLAGVPVYLATMAVRGRGVKSVVGVGGEG